MANLGQMWVNVVQYGKLRVDVGEGGTTWLTYSRCGLTWYNMANLGQMRVNEVEYG